MRSDGDLAALALEAVALSCIPLAGTSWISG